MGNNNNNITLTGGVEKTRFNPFMGMGNFIPNNVKAYLHQFSFSPRDLDERDFSQKEIGALRNAYTNRVKEKKEIADYMNKGGYIDPDFYDEAMGIRYNDTISYPNYNLNRDSFEDTFWGNIGNSLTNPNYVMESTIGRANYTRQPNGDVVIHDRYDFGGADLTNANPVYKGLHRVAERYGKPYNIDINIGNPDKW